MKKKMLHFVGILGLSVALSFSTVGCGTQPSSDPNVEYIQNVEQQNDSGIGYNSGMEDSGETDNSSDAEDDNNENDDSESLFYDGADLSGRVVEFSDTRCIITPETLTIDEDGGMVGGIAAPGYESEDTNITITYTEDTVFQIIYFSIAEEKEISREDADISSIKIETNVNIFGTCQEDQGWVADKVVITRWS